MKPWWLSVTPSGSTVFSLRCWPDQQRRGDEVVSGHRRQLAAMKLGVRELPVLVRDMTDDEAVILMVDSNIQRENLLPSEKAFAYKMKINALHHQGKTSRQLGEKWSVTQLSESGADGERQVHLL